MPVDTKHPSLKTICKKWDIVQDIVNNDAKKHLRTIDPTDTIRNEQYKNNGYLVNYTRITREGLKGLVFRRKPEYVTPQELDYIVKDATGNKLNIEQLAQKMTGEILDTGRYGLLVDAPNYEGGKARIKPYAAGSIINWRYDYFGDEYKLSLVVLHEKIEVIEDDFFDPKIEDQYRVLYLDAEGMYTQSIYDEDGDEVSSFMPLDFRGQPFTEILFTFVGSEDNNADIDSIPLYDIAVVNLASYKNTCDVEESSFVAGQLIPVINTGEAGEEEFKAANPNGIVIGSHSGIHVGLGGDFKIVQGSPNILPRELIKDKQDQIIKLGARLIMDNQGRETASAAKIRYSSQNSILHTITKNMNLALEQCLWWVSLMMMENPQESIFILNDQFYESDSDPILVMQQMLLSYDRGLVSAEEYRENLKKAGVKLDEDFVMEEVNPLDMVEDDEPAE